LQPKTPKKCLVLPTSLLGTIHGIITDFSPSDHSPAQMYQHQELSQDLSSASQSHRGHRDDSRITGKINDASSEQYNVK